MPRVPDGMLDRRELRSRVGRAPLTVVRAPGGSGKTVLMAQWATDQRSHGAWITVQPDTGNRMSFWRGVVESLPPALELRLPSEDVADSDVLRAALLRSFRGLELPVVLVVDDAHELQDAAVLGDLLAVLRACRNVTAVVGTRTRSDLEAPRESLTLDISVIEPDQLVLTTDEIEQIVGGRGSTFGTTDELLEASGGSPLLLRAILAGSSAGIGADGSAHRVIADHLRSLFRAQEELERFASTTAVPEDVDATAAGTLSDVPVERVATILESLEADGLVMRREVSQVTRYRYHPLVREVLRDELRRLRPELFRQTSLLASADAEARRQFLPALRHAVEAEDYLRASDVCLHGGFALLRSRGASDILKDVPFRYIARLPFLAVMLGLGANARGERLRALELLTLALGASRAWRRSQRVAEQAGLALIETVVLRITGRAGEAVAPARRLITILEKAPPGELDEIADQLGSYWLQAGLSLFRAGRLTEARAAAERVGISVDALADGAPERIGAVSLAAAVDAVRGECATASELLGRLEVGGHSAEVLDGYSGALAYLARGILALESGDPAEARRLLEAFGPRPNLEHGMLFAALAAFIALWDGAPEVGLRMLEHREATDRPRARVTGQDRQVLAATRTLLHAALGQVGPAYAAQQAVDRRDPLSAILHATLLVLEQRPGSAMERLSGHGQSHGPRLQAAAEVLTASASLMLGDEDRAVTALRRFVAIHAVHGTCASLVLVPAEVRAQLWALAERSGVDPATLADFRDVPAPLRAGLARAALTRREADVLEQLRASSSFAEIATNLAVSPNTVKSQARTLYRKLGASTRDDALRAAYLQGLLDD